MKQTLLIACFAFLLVGCNMNESKEARIRTLENQNEFTAKQLQKLENRIKALESKASESNQSPDER